MALVAVLAAALVVAGFVLGLRVAPETTAETAIGRVSFDVSPSLSGEATAIIPVADWGLRADAFDAPFALEAELRSLDRSALSRAAGGDVSILRATEDQLRDGARDAVVRSFAWGVAGAIALLVVATLIARGVRPRWSLPALGVTLTVVAVGGSLAAARASFDATAFERPTYFANGAELRRILEIVEDERLTSGYGSTFGNILRSITTVLAEAPAPGSRAPGRNFYLGSDLHANALVVQPLSEVIGDDPFLLAGDFGQRGGTAEARLLAPRVAALGSRVIATSGNHDTGGLMDALAGEGVRVLGDGESNSPGVVVVDGLRVAGFPDPLEWDGAGDPGSRPITFADLPAPQATFGRVLEDLLAEFDSLSPPPHAVMVHQNALAQGLARALLERGYDRDLTILTGHDHRQHVDRYGSVVVVDAGSVGAGGVFDAGEQPIGLANLHFEAAVPRLRSVDLISIEPFSGQAQASRVVIDSLCPDEERCSFEPPSPGESVLGDDEERAEDP